MFDVMRKGIIYDRNCSDNAKHFVTIDSLRVFKKNYWMKNVIQNVILH